MADPSHLTEDVQTDELGTNTQTTRNVLLKRNPHLRATDASSPAGFGGLGTRQFLQKQLMTPGSATSASSFEEGTSYDGFSDAGTPASEENLVVTKSGGAQHTSLHVKTEPGETTHYVTRTVSKQPTKRLSSPSRESLARRLSTKMPDEESRSSVDRMEGDLPPSKLLSNLVVKTVPSIDVGGEASTTMTTVPLSPRSTKVTRRIVASPRKTMRRVVVRRTGADGNVHEEVQYVDADGQVAGRQSGTFFNAEGAETENTATTSSSARTTATRRISTPGKTVRRVVVRRTGADGQVHEEVQFLDADGNAVEGQGAATSSTSITTGSVTSTPGRSTITRQIVTPAKLTRRTLRRTGADGHVHEEVQYLDVDGNVVQTEGGDVGMGDRASSSSGSVVTRRTVTPGKTIRRVLVRRTGADGQVHEAVQFMDADGNVVQSDGGELVETSNFTSVSGSDAPGSSSGRTTVTRRVVSPEQALIGADGNVMSTDGSDLSRSGGFTTEETITHEGSSETPGRRKVTHRVIRRMLVRKDGTSVPVEQYVDADGNVIEGEGSALVSAGSFTGSVSSVTSDTSTGTPSRRVVTRRVVASPGKVIRRSVVHKAGSSSGAESEEDVQYVESEGGDLARSGSFTRTVTTQSTPGRRVITHRVVTPQRVVQRMVTTRKGTAVEADVDDLDIDAEFVQSEDSASSDESVGGSSRGGGFTVSDRIVIPGSGARRAVSRFVTSSNPPQEEVENAGTEADASPSKEIVTSATATNYNGEEPKVSPVAAVATVAGAAVVASSVVDDGKSPDEEAEVAALEEDHVNVPSVDEPAKASDEEVAAAEKDSKQHRAAGGFWNFFGKSEENQVAAPSRRDEEPASSENPVNEQVAPSSSEDIIEASNPSLTATAVGQEAQQQSPDSEGNTSMPNMVATPSEAVEPRLPTEPLVETTVTAQQNPQSPHHVRRSSGGGFWGFFGKSEEEPKEDSDKEDAGLVDSVTTTATSPVEKPVETVNETSGVASESPRSDVRAQEFAQEAQQLAPVDEDGNVDETGDSTKTVVPTPAEGAASAFFVESNVVDVEAPGVDDKEASHSPRGDVVLPAVAGATAVVVAAAALANDDPSAKLNESNDDVIVETTTKTEEVADESHGGFWGFLGKSEPKKPRTSEVSESQTTEVEKVVEVSEDAAPATTAAAVEAPLSPSSVTGTSLVINDVQQELPASRESEVENPATPTYYNVSVSDDSGEDKAPAPAIETTQALVVDVPEPQRASETVASPGVATKSPRDNGALQTAAAAVAASSALHPIETATAESESPFKAPHRKTGRSIWSFRGADKPASPLTEDAKLKGEEQLADVAVVANEGRTPGDEQTYRAPVPRTGEARQYWQQQDQQNPTQISYAAAEGASYGPESKFESMPAADKLRSPVVEDEFDSGRVYHDAVPEADADIVVVADSQQPVERESVERDEPKEAKPARAGGFWGFLGKKSIESDEGKLLPDAAKHDDEAGAVVHAEAVRRSIPSDGTPTNVAGPVASSGKLVRESERRTTELVDGVEPDLEVDEHYVEVASPRHGGRALNDEGLWAVKPCSLAWSSLRLNRKSWKTAPADTTSNGKNEALLDGVSGSVKAGEFLVITGPSKDQSLALLSCLAGYEDATEGNVTVSGREWNETMNRYIAYVMREDLFYETLTVREHLVIQAKLRMRRTHTDEMCLERVERVMEDLGLSGCRDKLIGGGISLRGVTRGEHKLLALATALLTNPSILLVEEPTDGLDTFSAEKIVAKLRWLAFEQGLTVAVTLHHPSSHFYGLFDVLYLVADASCVYDGKAADAVTYFSTTGYQCPEYMSPLDYFMLQMVVGDRECDDEGVARVETLKREWAERNASVYDENAARAAAASEDAVVADYDRKNRYYHMGCCGQLWLLWTRHVRRLSRYGFVFWWHLLAALLVGVVFGLVYLKLDLNDQQGIQNFSGCFFYAVVVQMLFVSYRTFVFMPRETAIALRERQEYRGGWYHLLCWYFTKIAAELPALIVLSIALFVPVFLLVGVGHGFKVYLYMQIVMVLAGWAAIGLAFLTLGALRHVTLALIVYTVLLVLFVAFGGLLINVTDIPDWLVWLHYISPVKFAYEAMMKIFWKRVDSIDCDWTLEGCVALTGEGVLKYYSMENRSALGDLLILLAICFALFFFALWFLLMLANKRASGLQWRYDWAFKGLLGSKQQRAASATVSEKHAVTRSSMQRVVDEKRHHHSSAAVERSAVPECDNYYIRVETPRIGGHGLCDAPDMTLGWSSLWLKAQTDTNTKVDSETQYVLSDASGSAKCHELVLITGPSDESNVALLESLGGLQKRLKGKVTLNGVISTAPKLLERAAYVARADLFYETLTVEEHLRFQAQLVVGESSNACGLCCGTSAGDLEAERVEMVLDELELASKRHMLIRYLSAADTRLLAIATALLTNPSILLAEEPTCGMDFYSSQRVVLKLRQLARGGRTIVVTMAHPSSHLYALFDTLYLLADGAAAYHGQVKEAVPYFASLGYQCPQYMSPVDYFVRQVSARGQEENGAGDGHVNLFKEAWSTRYSELCVADNSEEREAQDGAGGASRRRVGCCGQLSLLFRRHLLCLARYRAVFGWHAFWMILLGVIFGLIFLQLDLDDQQDIQNWAGAFFFLVVLQMLVVAYRTFMFLPREMAIAEREHRFGGYYMGCWYLTKVFAELPALLVLSVLLFVPAYLLIGIGHGFKLYVYMQIVLWLTGWSAAGLATLLLGLFRRVRVGLIIYMLLLVLFVVFGGLLINVDDVPDYLIWLHYISPVKYGYEALMKLFWGRVAFLACGGSDGSGSGSATFATVGDDDSFSMSGSGSYEDDDDCIAHSGDEVLSHYSMDKSRNARSDSVILLEITVLCFCIGYAFLSLRWRRYKTRQQRNAVNNN